MLECIVSLEVLTIKKTTIKSYGLFSPITYPCFFFTLFLRHNSNNSTSLVNVHTFSGLFTLYNVQ